MTVMIALTVLAALPASSRWLLRTVPPGAEEYARLLEEDPDQALLLSARTGWLPGDSAVRARVEEMAVLSGRSGRLAAWAATRCGLRPRVELGVGLVELGPQTVLPDAPEACENSRLVHAGLLRALHSKTAGIPMQRPQDAVELAVACWRSLPDTTRALALQAAGRFEAEVPREPAGEMGTPWLRYLAETGGSLEELPDGPLEGLRALYAVRCLPDSLARGLVEHSDWFVRRAAAKTLAPEELQPLLDDPVPALRLDAALRMRDAGLDEGRDAVRELAGKDSPMGDLATSGLTAEDADLLEELLESPRPARRAAAQAVWLEYGLAVDSQLARSWETDPYWLVPVSWVYHLEQSGEMGRARTTAERIADMAEQSDSPERLLSYLEEIVTGGPAGAVEEAPAWPGGEVPFDPASIPRPQQVVVETSEGEIVLELLWDTAPIACANFVHLAEEGFYGGIWVHRVEPGFVAQVGCPEGNGMGGPGHTIPGEASLVPFRRGTVGMADAGPNTAGSQLFIMLDSHRRLDARYTAFARVARGMDAVERLYVGSRIEAVRIP